jgi:T-complex protein 1 subunit zeta
MLIIPKVLATNAGHDAQDVIVTLTVESNGAMRERKRTSDSRFLQEESMRGHVVGLDLATGGAIDPSTEGIWDCYRVKRQLLHSW